MKKLTKGMDEKHFTKSLGIIMLIFAIVFLAVGILFDKSWFTGKFGSNIKFGLTYKGKMYGKNIAPSEADSLCTLDSCSANSSLQSSNVQLTDEALGAFEEALTDEYRAYTAYSQVVDVYGQVQPFARISQAEVQHIAALQGLFQKYGKQSFENPWKGRVAVPQSLKLACKMGVDAEEQNYMLYENRWLPATASYSDVTAVFNNLLNASKNNHLPAFELCD